MTLVVTLGMLLVVATALWLVTGVQYAHQVEIAESLREQLGHARQQAHLAYVELSQCRVAFEAVTKARAVPPAATCVWDGTQQGKRN